jgi:calcium-dependent protein kinase
MVRAMKIISKDKIVQNESNLLEETDILIQMDHPNIVKLFEIFKDDSLFYLISEYCHGRSISFLFHPARWRTLRKN